LLLYKAVFSQKRIFFHFSLFTIVIVAIFLSFSRGALVLYGLYTIGYIGYTFNKIRNIRQVTIGFIGSIFVFSLIGFSLLTVTFRDKADLADNLPIPNSRVEGWIIRQIKKPRLAEDGRLRYWNQALSSIKERPLFGSGPGTFYLLSKRYQTAPNQYSWFAHNSIFQWTAELGIVGLSLYISLFLSMFKEVRKSVSLNEFSAINLLSFGVFLICLNSLYDYTFDFLVIWLIFWNTLAIMLLNYKYERLFSNTNN
jgi:O-antigen ligase